MKALPPILLALLVAFASAGCFFNGDSYKPPDSARKIARKDAETRIHSALGYLDLGQYDHAVAYANSFSEGETFHELAQMTIQAVEVARVHYYRHAWDQISGPRGSIREFPNRNWHGDEDSKSKPVIDVEKEKKFLTEFIAYYEWLNAQPIKRREPVFH